MAVSEGALEGQTFEMAKLAATSTASAFGADWGLVDSLEAEVDKTDVSLGSNHFQCVGAEVAVAYDAAEGYSRMASDR